MKTTSSPLAAFFRPRILSAVALCSVAATLGLFSFAATPPSGMLTDTSGALTYTSGPFTVSNATPILLVDSGPRCNANTNPCDSYALTIQLPAGYVAAHPNASVKVTMSWTDTGAGTSDYDLYIFKGTVGNLSGSTSADAQSSSSNNPEVANITLSNPSLFVDNGSAQQFTIKIVPYTATGEVVNTKIELIEGGAGGGGGGTFGGPDPTVPGNPRYQVFVPPVGSSAEPSDGEFNIGFNPATGRIMTMNIGPIWRLTPPEIAAPPYRPDPLPECCEALWQDRSAVSTDVGVDPILWTDQQTGRSFASNNTTGANALYAYSDDDGDTWVPVGGAPPSGADHETIGSGPFPAALAPLFTTPLNQGQYVLYCSQDLVGSLCQRSNDLGSSYGPAVPATGPGTANSQGCGGLHGHVHVAPNGTAWLPDKSCSNKAGGAVSLDASTTLWSEFVVEGNNDVNGGAPFTTVSQSSGADPSIGIDSDSTAYYAYVNNEANNTEGHIHVAVSTDNGATWIRDVDIGASHGIKNVAHVEAVGGSSGRAAVGFIATDQAGDYQASSFGGKWYAFISTTYDQGRTWTTVNATPNDPVQSKTGIWQQGGSHDDRNLLDFNEITIDDKGRVLYGYSDGCVTAGCINGSLPNDFVAHMRVARQTGGKTLFASQDPFTDTTQALLPKAPCLSGTRSPSESLLSWKAPDNGGSDITNYHIYRSNTSGTEEFIGETGSPSTTFADRSPPADEHLFYRVLAINGVGQGPLSNEIDLIATVPPPAENVCVVPGLTILTDKSGDTSAALGVTQTPAPAGSDLLSFQLAQPFQNDGIPRLVFTINTDANPSNSEPAGWAAYVALKLVNGTTTTYKGVHLTYKTGGPIFESYTPAPNSSGGVDGRFVTPGSEKPAEPGSNYDGPNGKITIIVKASDLGLNPGDTIAGFVSGVSQTTDPANTGAPRATTLYDQMPDSLAFASSYTVGDNQACAATPTPTPRPSATPTPSPSPTPTPTPTPTPAPTATPTPAPTATPTPTPTPTPAPTATPTPTPSPTPAPSKVKMSVTVSPSEVHEGGTAVYTITASKAAITQTTNVNYTMSGTATCTTDYTLSTAACSGQVIFQPGQTSAQVTLKAKKDQTAESTETAIMTLQRGTGYSLGRKNKQATVSILDGQ